MHSTATRPRAGDEVAELLTPVTKAWCTDVGMEVTSTAVQVFGGMGYIEEAGVSQHFRDMRIAPIYEGTNGIQAMDLVGRKLAHAHGRRGHRPPGPHPRDGRRARRRGRRVRLDARRAGRRRSRCWPRSPNWIMTNGLADPVEALAGATPVPARSSALVTGGWLLARQALAAKAELDAGSEDKGYLSAKITTARYYAEQHLPQAAGLVPMVQAGSEGALRGRRRDARLGLSRAGGFPRSSTGRDPPLRPVASPPHAGPRLHRCHRRAARCARERAAGTPGVRGAVPHRRPARRPDLGDQLRRARRGTPATGARGPHPRVADVVPDRLPVLVHRGGPPGAAADRHRGHRCASSGWSTSPDPRRVLDALPPESPSIGTERLTRSGPTVEAVSNEDLTETEHAIEVSYEGSYELDEATLADGSILDDHFSSMGGWISSTLVRLGDLNFEFLPPLEKDEG